MWSICFSFEDVAGVQVLTYGLSRLNRGILAKKFLKLIVENLIIIDILETE